MLAIGTPTSVTAAAPVTLGGTVGLSAQREGNSDSPYLGPGFGGAAPSATVFVDAGVAPRVTVGGEVGLAGRIEGVQQQRAPGGVNTLNSRHRDTLFSAVVKLKALTDRPVQVAVLGGVGVGWRQTHRAGTFRRYDPPFTPTPVAEQTLSDAVLATTIGIDGTVRLSPRLALIVAGRLHWLNDEDRAPDGVVKRGVSSTLTRIGGGVQVRF